MKRAAVLLVLVSNAALAQTTDVDWKLFGAASVDGASFCFFDAKSVACSSDGYIRVWTKCLAQKDLDGFDAKSDLGTKIVRKAAKEVIEGYVPPIVVIGQMEFKQVPDIVVYEQIANLGAINSQAQIFDELNCRERMTRTLSISIYANGQRGFDSKTGNWEYVPPEGNAATLLKLVCPMQ